MVGVCGLYINAWRTGVVSSKACSSLPVNSLQHNFGVAFLLFSDSCF